MPKYMCTWEVNPAAWPSDIKERMELAKRLMNEAKKGTVDGWIKDWGHYMGGGGYWILEGSNSQEVMKKMSPYSQYFKFYVQEALSVDEMLELYP